MRSPPVGEEETAKTTRDEQTTAPFPFHCVAGGEEVEEIGSRAQEEGIDEVKVILRFSSYFSLPYSDLIN